MNANDAADEETSNSEIESRASLLDSDELGRIPLSALNRFECMKTRNSVNATSSGPTLDDITKMRLEPMEDVVGNLKPPIEPSLEAIRARAYQKYLDEGCPEGRSYLHWLEAERELRDAH